MTRNKKRQRPVRLSDDELRKSRVGGLGRFPSEDLYEPEPEGSRHTTARVPKKESSVAKDGKRRHRSASLSVG